MAIEIANLVNAYGSTAAAGTSNWIAGASVAHPGAGIYNYTLETPINADQCVLFACALAAAPAADLTPTWVHTSDNVKQLTWTAAGVATNVAHSFLILQAPLS